MTCAKIAIVATKLHIYHQVCKNKIAHNTCSVQKFGVFMNFANNTLQMMKEMMFLRDEMTRIVRMSIDAVFVDLKKDEEKEKERKRNKKRKEPKEKNKE